MAKANDRPKRTTKKPKAKRQDDQGAQAPSLRQRTRSGARGGRGRLR
jgi:hypothetical protein